MNYINRTCTDNEMEGREKLHAISDGLKVLQDRRAGRVPRVKNLTCKLNFAIFNFAVRPQPRKFVDRENFPSYGMWENPYYDV